MQIFGRLNAAGRTIIIITHEDDVAAHAKRIIELTDGRISGDRRTAPVAGDPPGLLDLTAAGEHRDLRGGRRRVSPGGGRAVTLDSMRVALRGILANRMRSALTMLGILIGTAAVILLVAVGTGISNHVQVQIRTLGTNAVYVLPERNQGGQDRGGTSARRVRLTKADVKALSDRTRAPSVNAGRPDGRGQRHR